MLKNTTLVQRISLPIKEQTFTEKTMKFTPDMNNRPFKFSTLLSAKDSKNLLTSLNIAPFAVESIGQNHSKLNELVIFDTYLTYSENQKVYLDRFDLIKIKKFKIKRMPFDIESELSWDLQIGLKHINDKKYDYFSSASLGKTYQINEKIILFALAEFSLHSYESIFRLMPKVGTLIDFDKLKTLIYLGYEKSFQGYDSQTYSQIDMTYSIYKDTSIVVNYKKYDFTNISVGLQLFF
jgi:hypothetical protein